MDEYRDDDLALYFVAVLASTAVGFFAGWGWPGAMLKAYLLEM